jgi:hypothetical protein
MENPIYILISCSGAVATVPLIKPDKTEQDGIGLAQFRHSEFAGVVACSQQRTARSADADRVAD